MTRTPLVAALAVTTLVAGLTACQGPAAGPPSASATGLRSSASSGSSGSPGADGAVYVTGARAGDDACARVLSAIGYLGLSLLPSGQEDAQHWDGDVRGRFGYLRGTLAMYGPHLPASTVAATETIDRVAEVLSRADTPGAVRPSLLRRYRSASGVVTGACHGGTS
ncbi:hypothetical protein [Microbispora corallina]|nr:hypothetical protein [Microbispora corallina]